MYFMLTTLSTTGYGDFYPYSISEKVFGEIVLGRFQTLEKNAKKSKKNLRARAGAGSVIGPRSARLGYFHT